jgi:hypothetical protein
LQRARASLAGLQLDAAYGHARCDRERVREPLCIGKPHGANASAPPVAEHDRHALRRCRNDAVQEAEVGVAATSAVVSNELSPNASDRLSCGSSKATSARCASVPPAGDGDRRRARRQGRRRP